MNKLNKIQFCSLLITFLFYVIFAYRVLNPFPHEIERYGDFRLFGFIAFTIYFILLSLINLNIWNKELNIPYVFKITLTILNLFLLSYMFRSFVIYIYYIFFY